MSVQSSSGLTDETLPPPASWIGTVDQAEGYQIMPLSMHCPGLVGTTLSASPPKKAESFSFVDALDGPSGD